jgi:cytochrome c biogenesis protein CcmG/thiol:disulfide interchange protein DsbE
MRAEDVPKSGRVRSVPMIDQVAVALDQLSRRPAWTGGDDLVSLAAVPMALSVRSLGIGHRGLPQSTLRGMSVRTTIAVLAVLAVIGLLTYGLLSKGSTRPAVGDPAPNVRLPRLEGDGERSLGDYRGRWVLVNLWASWCGPCRQEAPALEKFQKQYASAQFTILGIDSRDLSSDGTAFIERYGISYPQLRDGNGEAAHAFGSTGVPETFLVDPRGRLRSILVGPATPTFLSEEVAPLLGPPRRS